MSTNRSVENKTVLSNGVVLPKGSRLSIFSTRYKDPEVFLAPETFDAAKFVKLREISGQENAHQAVDLGANRLLFGAGLHACPDRYFVINEIKIALYQMLLKYVWRLVDGEDPPFDFPSPRSNHDQSGIGGRVYKESKRAPIRLQMTFLEVDECRRGVMGV